MKRILRRIFCKHKYRHLATFSGTHWYTDKDVIFDQDFMCTNCGKVLAVKMDEDYQVQQHIKEMNSHVNKTKS